MIMSDVETQRNWRGRAGADNKARDRVILERPWDACGEWNC